MTQVIKIEEYSLWRVARKSLTLITILAERGIGITKAEGGFFFSTAALLKRFPDGGDIDIYLAKEREPAIDQDKILMIKLNASPSQRNVLTDFYEKTNGDKWTNNEGWLSNKNKCKWYGITCGSNGKVVEINPGEYSWIQCHLRNKTLSFRY